MIITTAGGAKVGRLPLWAMCNPRARRGKRVVQPSAAGDFAPKCRLRMLAVPARFVLVAEAACSGLHAHRILSRQTVGGNRSGPAQRGSGTADLLDESVDVWLHLDVLEHLFNPFQAMREIYRTLVPGGVCLFTAPTYPDRARSEQVAFLEPDGSTRIVGQAEYHGNPQHPEQGSLVTWRYGYDLPLLLQRETRFDVEVRRWQSKAIAVMGPMTEVYICRKPSP